MLDRLIRGRLWIGLIAFALIGIVAMQLVVLRLNTEIGSGLERKATLQREISDLQASNSNLSAFSRVETEAGRRGMRLATQAESSFLGTQGSDAIRAAALLSSNPPLGSTGRPSASSTPSSGEAAQGSTTRGTQGATSGGPAGEQPAPSQPEPNQAAASSVGEGPPNPVPSTQPSAGSAAEATATGQGNQAGGQGQAAEGAAAQPGAGGEPPQQEGPQPHQEGPQG